MRNLKEQVVDKLFLLYTIKRTNELFASGISGRVKLQKLCFLEEWELMKSNAKGLHFKFFRYTNGPFSVDVAEDYKFLARKGRVYGSMYRLTSEGEILLDSFLKSTRDISDNAIFFDILDKVIKKWGNYFGQALMNKVYKMKIKPHDYPDREMTIRDIPIHSDILVPEMYTKFVKLFDMPDDLIEDFTYVLNLDSESRKKMRRSSGVSYASRFK